MKLAILLPVVCLAGDSLGHLEAIHAQRVEWMKARVVTPAQGIYRDFRAVWIGDSEINDALLRAAKSTDAQILLRAGDDPDQIRSGFLIRKKFAWAPGFQIDAPKNGGDPKHLKASIREYPDEVFEETGELPGISKQVALRHQSQHILATEFTPAAIEESIQEGRIYTAFDWLCDPAGFTFVAENSFGAYDIGDTVPIMKGTRLVISLPVQGTIRIYRDNNIATAQTAAKLEYPVVEQGSYRVEVTLAIEGKEWPWISTKPITVGPPRFTMPMGDLSPNVDVHKGIAYIDDGNDKHRLDLYLPRDKKNFPVMLFLHGGAWRSGDRSLYGLFGNRFAKAGVGVVVPSYRLMPKDPHPAQIEDAAAAFDWVYKNIAQFGGDVGRIYVAGHSAGGHLAALLALDPEWLKKYDISPGAIRGVALLSGVYDVSGMDEFKNANASPIHFVHARVPPFLISYCQWDYRGLPKQARDFAAALRKEFAEVRLLYVPKESHISEMIATLKDDDPTARALIDFVK